MNRPSLALAAVFVLAAACVDPTRDSEIEALGEETNGIEPGPRHRAGQPCLACHVRGGTADELAVGGTVYATRTGTAPAPNVDVTLQDATGARRTLKTNDVGNFHLSAKDWSPQFPLFVRIEGGGRRRVMQTRIGRNGGCAFCHRGPRPKGDPAFMPPIFLEDR